jgi:HK97 family phage major capsid protein
MSAEIRRLNEERARAVADMRALLESSKKENRSLTNEEQGQYDKLFARQDELKGAIERENRQAEIEHELRTAGRGSEAGFSTAAVERNSGDEERAAFAKKAYRTFLKHGMGGLNQEEVRALSAGNHIEGGAVVPPVEWINQLLKAVDDLTVVRAAATKYRVEKALSVGVPVLDSDPADGDWTTELGTGTEDSSMKFGSRELSPNPLAKRIKVSNKLIRASIVGVEELVMQRMAYKFAITEEKALMTGSGVNQPLGLFTAHASGISTSRDVVGSNTTTAIAADTLFDVKYALKQQYQATGSWLFHRDAVKAIMKLKDNQNQYLWQPSIQMGQPDMLLGRPVLQSEYVPNTFTSGKYVGLFGDLSYVWVVDALDMSVQKLVELYAETGQTGYIGRMEMDGAPVLQEAFARVKLG